MLKTFTKNTKKVFIRYWPLFVILLITAFFFLFRLGRDFLWDWDECLYSVYARSMKTTGFYLNNVWNGYIDLQKPPLYTWLLQLPTLFVTNEFTLRILSVIGSLLILISVYVFAKKYFSSTVALLATLILLTTEVFVIYSLKVNTDIIYTLFIFLAFYIWLLSYKKKGLSYISGVLFAAAVMVKGLSVVSFLVAIFLSIFLDPKKEKFLNFLRMFFVMLILILPWHILAYLKYGNYFVQIYFIENLIKRTRNPIEFHYGGRLYYVKQLFNELFPWLFFVLVLPLYYLINLKKYFNLKKLRAELKDNQVIFTVLLLVLIPFGAITNVKTKLPWYTLSIYPFFAILIAYSIVFLLKRFKFKNILLPLITLFLVVDAFSLIFRETHFLQNWRIIDERNEVAIKASLSPKKEIYYLVQASERTAKDLLDQSPNLQIRSTFVYGGNPCAVYYSDKKVNYFYSIEDFKKSFTNKKGLFIIENGDKNLIKKSPKKRLFENDSFTLFEN